MIEDLDKFLNSSQNIKHAVLLYNKLGTNQSLKDLILKYPDSKFAQDKIIAAIKELREKTIAITPIKPVKQVKESKETFVKPSLDRAEEIIIQLDKRKGVLFREAAVLHAHLHHMTYKEMQKAVPCIVTNWQEIDRIWIIKHNYTETGQLPKEFLNEYTLKEYVNRLKTLPTYITKIKKELLSLDEDSELYTKKIAKLGEYETEFNQLTLMLENDDITIQP